MGSKQKQTRMGQKESIERRLEDRLSFLSKKGIESPAIEKDAIVKKLRADVRAVNTRLKAIAANEKRTEGLAKMKAERAEKAAAPQEEKEVGKGKEPKEPPREEGEEKKKKKVKKTKEEAASQEKVEK